MNFDKMNNNKESKRNEYKTYIEITIAIIAILLFIIFNDIKIFLYIIVGDIIFNLLFLNKKK